jgi:hypothetical protein
LSVHAKAPVKDTEFCGPAKLRERNGEPNKVYDEAQFQILAKSMRRDKSDCPAGSTTSAEFFLTGAARWVIIY